MATFRADARAALERARASENLLEKVAALEDTVSELMEELSTVLSALGPENFSDLGRKAMKEE